MRLITLSLLLLTLTLRGANIGIDNLDPTQFTTNNVLINSITVHTNEYPGIIRPALANYLTTMTNVNQYGTVSLPSKVTSLSLGTNYLDLTQQSSWLLNSPTNDATQVILSLSAGAYQGQEIELVSQNDSGGFTLPNLSEQYDVPGGLVIIGSDWIGTTNRGLHLKYSSPDIILFGIPTDPSQPGGGGTLWTNSPSGLRPIDADRSFSLDAGTAVLSNTVASAGLSMLTIASSDVNIYIRADTGLIRMDHPIYGYYLDLNPENAIAPGFILDFPNLNIPQVQWAHAHTNIFTVSGASGYTGSGTNLLSDDGTYKPAGTVAATNVLWASAGGNLFPSPAVDVVSITSQSADNATNVALVVDTSADWISDDEQKLTAWRRHGTNVAYLTKWGALEIGKSVVPYWNPDKQDGLIAVHDSSTGEAPTIFLTVAATDHPNANDGNFSELVFLADSSSALGQLSLNTRSTNSTLIDSSLDLNVGDDPSSGITYSDTQGTWFSFMPLVTSTGSSIAYRFGTSNTLTNGDNVAVFKNAVEDRLSVMAAVSGLIFGPGNTNVFYRSGGSLIYTNGLTTVDGVHFEVANGDGVKADFGVDQDGVPYVSSPVGKNFRIEPNAGSPVYNFASTSFFNNSSNTVSLGTTSTTWKDASIGNPGSGPAVWKLGKKLSGSVLTLTTNYYEVEVDGVLGAIPIVTVTP